jgi:hypothetical protein
LSILLYMFRYPDMAVNSEDRMTELRSLNDFIDNSRKRITSILSFLGWDEDTLKQKVRLMFCVLYV